MVTRKKIVTVLTSSRLDLCYLTMTIIITLLNNHCCATYEKFQWKNISIFKFEFSILGH